MIIREATPYDKQEIIALYKRSQAATGLPDPAVVLPQQLGTRLYSREALARYVAVEDRLIVGHGLIERANPDHLAEWQNATDADSAQLIELGGAFVESSKIGRGIWSALLLHRITVVRSMGATPVSVTWSVNEHVKKRFREIGGTEIAQKTTQDGDVSIFTL